MKSFINWIKSLFSKKTEEKQVVTSVTIQEQVVKNEPQIGLEPKTVKSKAKITSFLWKPVSDTDPKVMVVSVSADNINSKDLRMYIEGPKGKPIKGDNDSKVFVRQNILPGHKYGRINFKYGQKADFFKPGTRVVFELVTGERVLVMDKEYIVVKNPLERLDLK
jgi:hypothetical protein